MEWKDVITALITAIAPTITALAVYRKVVSSHKSLSQEMKKAHEAHLKMQTTIEDHDKWERERKKEA